MKNKKVPVLCFTVVLFLMSMTVLFTFHSRKTSFAYSNVIVRDEMIYLPSGDIISAKGSTILEDSSIKLTDGRIISPDGSITNPDGSIIMKNGSVYKNGCLLLKNGVIVDKNGRVAMPDGSIRNDMEVVINNDNTATINNRYNLAIDDFMIVVWNLKSNKELIDKNINFPIVYSDDVINILVAGLDKHIDKTNGKPFSRSDSILLLSIDKTGKSINTISISRATLVNIDGYGKHRINEAYQYGGADLLVDTVQKNFKIKIDYYIAFDFELFIKTVDILGGIDIELTSEEKEYFKNYLNRTNQKITADGTYHFDGKEALIYARLREIDSDRARTGRQRKVVYNLKAKLNNLTFDQIYEIYDGVYKKIDTNMNLGSVLRRLPLLLRSLNWRNKEFVLPRQPSDSIQNDDGYEVLLAYWPTEVNYLRSALYKNTNIKVLQD